MNKIENLIAYVKSNLVIKIWLVMIILFTFIIIGLMIVQYKGAEPLYKKVLINEVDNQIVTVVNDSNYTTLEEKCDQIAVNINGGVSVVSESGQEMYNVTSRRFEPIMSNGKFYSVDNIFGIRLQPTTVSQSDFYYDFYKDVIDGNELSIIYEQEDGREIIIVGIPVIINSEYTAFFAYRTLPSVTNFNLIFQNQLISLAVFMLVVLTIITGVISVHFVHPIKQLEEAICKIKDGDLVYTLELNRTDELGHLSGEVKRLTKELQKVDNLRKDVISNASHELRSPLVLIRGYAEMVRDITWQNDELRDEQLSLIISEAVRMNNMVNEILDYSQIMSGFITLNLESVNFYDFIVSETKVSQEIANNYDINIKLVYEADKTVMVIVDELKMTQVMRNLFNNAINHNMKTEDIYVVVTQNKNVLHIEVRNKGIPIPVEERELIFERYHRVQHQSGRKEGTGIGLSIVKNIYEAHGMKYGVTFENEYNVFWYEIVFEGN